MKPRFHPTTYLAALFAGLVFCACLSEEDGPDSAQIVELDVRSEHQDGHEAWWLLARVKVPGDQPPESPDAVVATLLLPGGETVSVPASSYDPTQERYELSLPYLFSTLVPSGTYRSRVPSPGGTAETVQDSVQVSFLGLPTLVQPVFGARVDCTPFLQWLPVERATRYQVLLRKRHETATLYSDTISTTELTVPPGVLAFDTQYEWKVYAFDRSADGDVDNQSKSKFSRFVVTERCS